jgi:ABC-2 type transport system permease protein
MFSVMVAGEIVDGDRHQGTLELLVAAPGGGVRPLLGRAVAVGGLAFVCFAETWFSARLLFGIEISVPHPAWFAGALVVTCLATMAASLVIGSLLVLTRSAETWMASLGFPVYVLGGVFVPVAELPGWLQPVCRLVFLSWSGDLLRAALRTAPIAPGWGLTHLAAISLLGLATGIVGAFLAHRVLTRVRRSGRISI